MTPNPSGGHDAALASMSDFAAPSFGTQNGLLLEYHKPSQSLLDQGVNEDLLSGGGGDPTELRAGFRRRGDDAAQECARKSERHRIAQRIHDDLGGVLTGLKACISVLMASSAHLGQAPDPLLADASALADIAFGTIRQITADLRPAILEQMGLWAAFDWSLGRLARRSKIHCDLFVDPAVTAITIGEECESMIFRVVGEALTNVERHAQASYLLVRVFVANDALIITVEDDGIGISDCRAESMDTLGISGMKEQAREFGAAVTVSSNDVLGSVVRLSVRLERNDGLQ